MLRDSAVPILIGIKLGIAGSLASTRAARVDPAISLRTE